MAQALKPCVAYLALGINTEGHKALPGLWIAETEGAKFWLSVMNALKNRGVHAIFIACTDGLKGFPEATEAVYPKTQGHKNPRTALYCASGASLAALCELEATQGCCGRP